MSADPPVLFATRFTPWLQSAVLLVVVAELLLEGSRLIPVLAIRPASSNPLFDFRLAEALSFLSPLLLWAAQGAGAVLRWRWAFYMTMFLFSVAVFELPAAVQPLLLPRAANPSPEYSRGIEIVLEVVVGVAMFLAWRRFGPWAMAPAGAGDEPEVSGPEEAADALT